MQPTTVQKAKDQRPIKWIWGLLIALIANQPTQSQQTPQNYSGPVNYVRVWDAKAPEQNHNVLITRPLKDVVQSTSYVDGLGRPIQTVVKQGSLPTGSSPTDLVSFINYDAYGRETHKFLPYASAASDGNFKPTVSTEHNSFNSTRYGPQGESFFYGQTQFEASPLSRVLKSTAPGNSWAGSNRGVSMDYEINDWSDDVRIWNVNGAGSYSMAGTYAPGQLYKNITTDEHGKKVTEYKDKEGKVILKKVQIDASPGASYSGWLCTYYLYDDFGQLRLVIQPEGVKTLPGSGWILSTALLNEQCFRYEYDGRGRMIEKKVPGAGLVEMVYDNRDRLALSRDANLTNQGKWLYTRYDALNRPTETGFMNNSAGRSTFQWYADIYANPDFPYWWWSYETLTQTFYDDYSWNPSGYGVSASLNTSYIGSYSSTDNNSSYPYERGFAQSTATQGMVTGTRVKILGSTNFITTVNIYDKDGRLIQTQTKNHAGGVDIHSMQYSFSGLVISSTQRTEKTGTTATDLLTKTDNTYDDLGRLTSSNKTVSGTINNSSVNTSKQINQQSYDAMGQLKTKKLAPYYTATNGLQLQNFEYNIRGWLLGINKLYINPTQDLPANTRFGFELAYDKPANIAGGDNYTPQYNGNIAGSSWRSMGDGESRRFDYSYDNANRIMTAVFRQFTSSQWNQAAGLNFTSIMGDGSDHNTAYDANGNIKRMQQWGVKGTAIAKIDDLNYTYQSQSNKLQGVTDGTGTTNNQLGDFTDKNNSNNDYSYDANGNLISDANKDISSITYNHLNLPQTISITGKGTINYVYDAAGNKLSKTVNETGQPAKTTLYVAGAVYENDQFQFMGHEEGRFRHAPSVSGGVAFDYMLKDHLGNVRMVLTDEQKTDAYPAATMETAQSTTENQFYANINATREDKPSGYPSDTYTSPNDKVAKVNGNGNKVGPTIILKVMAGDSYNLRANSWYRTNGNSPGTPVSPLTSLVSALANGIAGMNSNKYTTSYLQSTGVLDPGITNFLNSQGSNSNLPKAFVNWILFDEQFKQVGGGSEQVGDNEEFKTHIRNGLAVNKNGYLYIYVSNETPNIDVFFDNLQVTHIHGPLVEETHYYPFGLTMAGISSKAAGSLDNKRKWNKGTELENKEFSDGSGLELYATPLRSLDPQLGRWWQIDSKPDYAQSLYAAMGNNPILYNDPLGDTLPRPVTTTNMFSATNWYGVSAVKASNERVEYTTNAAKLDKGSPTAKQDRINLQEKARANTPEPFNSVLESGRPMKGEYAKLDNPSVNNPAKTNIEVNETMKTTGALGRALVVGGALNSAVNVATSKDPASQMIVEAGAWTGAIKFGSTGAALGSVAGPVGSFVGGVGGSILGGIAGSKLATWVVQNGTFGDARHSGSVINGVFIPDKVLDKR